MRQGSIYVGARLLILGVVICLSLTACKGQHIETADAKLTNKQYFRPDCVMREGKMSCLVNFYSLNANARFLDEHQITILGFLGTDQGRLMLFPSEADFENMDTTGALKIRADPIFQKKKFEELGYSGVVISGKLRLNSSPGHRNEMGEIFATAISWPGKNIKIPSSSLLYEANDEEPKTRAQSNRPAPWELREK